MQANLRRTRGTGMKGEKRAADAMVISDKESAEECIGGPLDSQGVCGWRGKSGMEGARGGVLFFDLAVSVLVVQGLR